MRSPAAAAAIAAEIVVYESGCPELFTYKSAASEESIVVRHKRMTMKGFMMVFYNRGRRDIK